MSGRIAWNAGLRRNQEARTLADQLDRRGVEDDRIFWQCVLGVVIVPVVGIALGQWSEFAGA